MHEGNLVIDNVILPTQKVQTSFHDGPFLDYDPVDEGAGRCGSNAAALQVRQPWRPPLRRSAAPAAN